METIPDKSIIDARNAAAEKIAYDMEHNAQELFDEAYKTALEDKKLCAENTKN